MIFQITDLKSQAFLSDHRSNYHDRSYGFSTFLQDLLHTKNSYKPTKIMNDTYLSQTLLHELRSFNNDFSDRRSSISDQRSFRSRSPIWKIMNVGDFVELFEKKHLKNKRQYTDFGSNSALIIPARKLLVLFISNFPKKILRYIVTCKISPTTRYFKRHAKYPQNKIF